MMILILCFILFVILIWATINRLFIPKLPDKSEKRVTYPLLSVLVPLRNEERNVGDLLSSLSKVTYPNVEFFFLDDGSTDQTRPLLETYSQSLTNVTIIDGKPLPIGWVGKVHACYQLGAKARGEFLVFIDADIRIKPNTLHKALQLLEKHKAGLLTGFPFFPTTSFLSKLLVPMQHMIVLMHLPLFMANYTMKPAFTAAHGAFMFFSRAAYEKAGGHQTVQNSLVEDVHLTRAVKKSGSKAIIANVTTDVTCHMYDSNKEVWEGFSKNIFPGIGRSVILAVFLSIFYFMLFIVPLPLALYGLFTLQFYYLLPLTLTWMIKFFIDRSMNQEKWLWLFMPLSAVSLLLVLYRSMFLSFNGKGFVWKGRRYS
ncbi:glycosyltransferase [Alkalihalophilus pseudofirmus]|uniref:glycosyltransferase n=1 Tax=Alkalihalophilus pseudofirmus TaxID=79885 RepID=UPI00259BDD58|nr:glycosyltransferase [Alkalihalophilus pseudofirmus]WEG18173.1 glycosyltransferase [Alkalihalophilus pseudofirmus]